MPASHPPVPARSACQPDTASLRCEGHMADDVAATYGAEPCAVLTATPDELWLKGNRGDFRLPRSAVVRIGRGGLYPWFFKGIRIRHQNAEFPSNIQFKELRGRTDDLIAQPKLLGYPTT
jgi:hypothetical protein